MKNKRDPRGNSEHTVPLKMKSTELQGQGICSVALPLPCILSWNPVLQKKSTEFPGHQFPTSESFHPITQLILPQSTVPTVPQYLLHMHTTGSHSGRLKLESANRLERKASFCLGEGSTHLAKPVWKLWSIFSQDGNTHREAGFRDTICGLTCRY